MISEKPHPHHQSILHQCKKGVTNAMPLAVCLYQKHLSVFPTIYNDSFLKLYTKLRMTSPTGEYLSPLSVSTKQSYGSVLPFIIILQIFMEKPLRRPMHIWCRGQDSNLHQLSSLSKKWLWVFLAKHIMLLMPLPTWATSTYFIFRFMFKVQNL